MAGTYSYRTSKAKNPFVFTNSTISNDLLRKFKDMKRAASMRFVMDSIRDGEHGR
jgi:hypothetical protein